MKSICNLDCCDNCSKLEACGGCLKCDGHPFNGECIAANCIKNNGYENYLKLKEELIKEINELGIKDLTVSDLNLLNGEYVNLEYEVEGNKMKFLNDKNIYFANQIERENKRCLGVVASLDFILVCEYGEYGKDPILLAYKKRI